MCWKQPLVLHPMPNHSGIALRKGKSVKWGSGRHSWWAYGKKLWRLTSYSKVKFQEKKIENFFCHQLCWGSSLERTSSKEKKKLCHCFCHLLFQVLVSLELGRIFPCWILNKRRKEESLRGKGIRKAEPTREEGKMRDSEKAIWNEKCLTKFKKVVRNSGRRSTERGRF